MEKKFREFEKTFSGEYHSSMSIEHFCPILVAAEKISGNSVDCTRKGECNRATACVIFREYGSWDDLVQHFVEVANETARLEENFMKELKK